MAETILIELVVDDSQLQPAIDLLEKTGQIDSKLANSFRQTTAEINKQAAAIKADAASTAPLKKNLEDVNKAVKGMTASFMEGFQEGVIDTLKEAGVTAQQFADALATGATEVSAPAESLRQRLRALTEQISQLKLAGHDNTEQFRELVTEAGRIKDAMGDAGQVIRNVASDTNVFDGLIGAAQGIAGGFAVAQGAAALFGDESEEIQKTLLKVNAAMSILQGLQQVQTVLLKESAAATLGDTIAKNFNTLATKLYTAITGQATQATIGFKVALASTGIGLLVVGIIAAVQAFKSFASGADDAAESQQRLNEAIGNANEALAQSNAIYVQAISQQKAALEEELALAEARGESETKLLGLRRRIAQEDDSIGKKSLENLGLTRIGVEKLEFQYSSLIQTIATLNAEAQKDPSKRGQEAAEVLRSRIQAQADAIKPLLDAGLQAVEQIDGAQQKSVLLNIALQKENQRIAKEALQSRLKDELAALERRLLAAEEGSERELRLQQEIANKKAQIELTAENLTKQQRLLIREQTLKENLEKEKAYNEKLLQDEIQAQISRNNAELVNVRATQEEKLLLTISNIELQSALEVAAAEGNAAKIKEINARRDAEIAAARKADIEQQAQNEIELTNAVKGAENRALQRLVDNEKAAVRVRIAAAQQLADSELDNIRVREEALNKEIDQRLISEQEYNLRYKKLQDEKAVVVENTEKKITDIQAAEIENRRKKDQETIELVILTTQQVLDIVGQINDIRTQKDEDRIRGERARIEELREAGAITEKQALERTKRLDVEEKRIKREAAQRDKNLAIFNAIINTAQAVTKALASAPPPFNAILAGIAGALGAAQIAVIASRPIPKFRTGKKNKYEGPGIIGEAGAELFEHDGRMYVANKETIVWMGKDDKVYTPTETKQMLPEVDHKVMNWHPDMKQQNEAIDYEQLGKAVGKHVKIPGVTVDEDGFKVWQQEGMSRKNYMDKYYSSK